ncbi:MbnP family protein [Jiulongibacter sp. NS-SX5]|uniref:MbnP family protein n=1 Tax=Jiulongibacter sp. NS-SX5 TaxID=3463854 RepID=UPI00405919C2
MKNLIKTSLFFAAGTLLFSSCDSETMEPSGEGNLILEFDNRIGSDELYLGQTQATNASGETYTLSTLNYFVSNINITDMAGNTISFPDEYFLVKESDAATQQIELTGLPAGNYHHISFIIGVDSVKSISDVSQRVGVLDPASYGDDNMYWSWNMGYIFFKMEGYSSAASATPDNKFAYHIGGFGGKDAPTPNNLRTVELHMDDMAEVTSSVSPQAHIIFDVSKVFDGSSTLSIGTTPVVHNPMVGKPIAANYAAAFLVDHVHNH